MFSLLSSAPQTARQIGTRHVSVAAGYHSASWMASSREVSRPTIYRPPMVPRIPEQLDKPVPKADDFPLPTLKIHIPGAPVTYGVTEASTRLSAHYQMTPESSESPKAAKGNDDPPPPPPPLATCGGDIPGKPTTCEAVEAISEVVKAASEVVEEEEGPRQKKLTEDTSDTPNRRCPGLQIKTITVAN